MKSRGKKGYNRDMEEMMSEIKNDRCDDCGCKGVGVMHNIEVAPEVFTPNLFLCRQCDGTTFEKVARRDIDAWLAGRNP